jgi:hypothetical protein
MYVNGKMRPVETIPGIREVGIKEYDGGDNSSMIYLIHCKNFHKCHNVPSTKIKKCCYTFRMLIGALTATTKKIDK